jgi:hypothetical protein
MTQELVDATPEQVVAVVEQVPDLPWPDGDEQLEWEIDGIEGVTTWFMHVLPLAATTDAPALASFLTSFAELADRRWGGRHLFDAALFTDDATTDAAAYDRRSAPADLVRSYDATQAVWWELGSDAVMLLDGSSARPKSLAAVLVLPAQWMAAPGAEEAALATPLVDDLLSRDNSRVLHAVWEVIGTRDADVLAPLATALPAIERATDDLDLGGALLSNQDNLDHALDRIRLFEKRRCLCAAYPDHVRYEPAKEEASGHVRIVAEAPVYYNGMPGRPKRLCECTACGQRFEVEEGEYHYTWWKWVAVSTQPDETPPHYDTLVDVAVAALTYPWTRAEDAASRRPPYPIALGLQPLIAELVAALPPDASPAAATVDHGRLLRHERQAYRYGADDWSRVRFVNRLPRVLFHLLAHGVLGVDDGQRLVDAVAEIDPLVAARLREQLVLVHLERDDLAAAAEVADQMGTRAREGWRDIGFHHADRGEVAEFLALWSQYDARQDRAELDDMVRALVGNVARLEGWRVAIALCGNERRIGEGHRVCAFSAPEPWPWPPLHTADELLALFAGDAAGVLDEVEELTCLVDAVRRETPEPPRTDHPAVSGLLDRIIALDPTESKQMMRTRDQLLGNLWMALGDRASLDRMVKAVRAPRLRADLRKGLPRETGGRL